MHFATVWDQSTALAKSYGVGLDSNNEHYRQQRLPKCGIPTLFLFRLSATGELSHVEILDSRQRKGAMLSLSAIDARCKGLKVLMT